ncbi:hypothetical protein [Marinospirillum sp.]|uniref:hypothetical protein n=1 Tax=Marinospirillum sp. TaxID=2183934 RepID=UPI00384C46B6
MSKKSSEKERLQDQNESSHTYEPLPQELSPLERLKGSVLHYERPCDSVWEWEEDEDADESDNIGE